MQRIKQFLTEAGKWGVSLMTGGLFSFTLALIEHLRGNSFTALTWVLVGFLAFMAGAFFAWLNERKKVEEQDRQRGRPEITAEFKAIGGSPLPTWTLHLHNSSDYPAVDIHIDDIRYGDRVLRFMPPSSLVKGQVANVRCGILCNGWTETNDISSLFLSENTVPLQTPVFNLKLNFSSLDNSNRRHWIFRAAFYYETQQRRLVLTGQRVDVMQ
jgi:hypothetical protein